MYNLFQLQEQLIDPPITSTYWGSHSQTIYCRYGSQLMKTEVKIFTENLDTNTKTLVH
jgi:hypothetical protein